MAVVCHGGEEKNIRGLGLGFLGSGKERKIKFNTLMNKIPLIKKEI